MARWLDRRGLGHVADSVDKLSVAEGNVAAWHDMARRAMGRGEWQRAEELLHQAMALAPSDPSLLCSLGATYRRKGDFAAARTAYEQALAIRPDYPEVLSNLGEWCLANRQREEALDWLEQALAGRGLLDDPPRAAGEHDGIAFFPGAARILAIRECVGKHGAETPR